MDQSWAGGWEAEIMCQRQSDSGNGAQLTLPGAHARVPGGWGTGHGKGTCPSLSRATDTAGPHAASTGSLHYRYLTTHHIHSCPPSPGCACTPPCADGCQQQCADWVEKRWQSVRVRPPDFRMQECAPVQVAAANADNRPGIWTLPWGLALSVTWPWGSRWSFLCVLSLLVNVGDVSGIN